MKYFEVNLKMKEGVRPKFYRARPVPYALKPAVEEEIERLLSEGIFEEVPHSEWAAPTVPVEKTMAQSGYVEILNSQQIKQRNTKSIQFQRQRICSLP